LHIPPDFVVTPTISTAPLPLGKHFPHCGSSAAPTI
jgi:hypothetical protein